ncbi:Holliday junction branch migration protein RuvA [Citricoccus sp. NR2]|uniref:Holliday junction branch migration protein RuvA n=1 Tax=Citricoccus sp. NR2 TaxID=3004095 RepID=UPI0022DD490D|nr:Holliday junction branch migration protein RuvA [Citricoccus sp. NR2]WBL18175.1 Holliday junction branch migration protein RuvA [Citricoccus sp. NR2]
MIASLTGTVEHVGLNQAVLNVSGIGYLFSATPQTLATLREGEQGRVLTSMIVREESMTLFGFATTDEREIFEIMMGVSGVGPRTALAVLAVHAPDAVRWAVAHDDEKAFTKVSGIGPKGARRILLELSGKLTPVEAPPTAASEGTSPAGQEWMDQVVGGLTGLGWNDKDAQKALETTVRDEPELAETQDVARILRATLSRLGRDRSTGGSR